MSKRPTDVDEPPAKKRGSSRQLTKDDESEEEVEEAGVFQQAPEEVLAKRRIVKARRGTGAPPPTPSGGPPPATSNPFAGVSLTGSLQASNGFAALAKNTAAPEPSKETAPAQAAAEDAKDKKQEPQNSPAPEAEEASRPADGTQAAASTSETARAVPSFGSFAAAAGSSPWTAASSGTAFGFANAGTTEGKATSAAAGSADQGGASASNTAAEAVKPSGGFSFNNSAPSGGFSFGTLPASGGFPSVQSIFGNSTAAPAAPASNGSTPAGGSAFEGKVAALPEETETVTGEEEEETLWAGEGTLYEFDAARQWRERGKGELRINRAPGRAARFVMRQRGFLRLLMNANLWPEMKVTPMDGGKGATFSVMNVAKGPEEQKEDAEVKLQTFAFRIKAVGRLDEFVKAVTTYKVAPADIAPADKVQGSEAV